MTFDERDRSHMGSALWHLDQIVTSGASDRASVAVRRARRGLRETETLESSAALSTSTAPEGDSLSKLLADMEAKARAFGLDSWSAELRDRLRVLIDTEPENDVITGAEVTDLPPGSLVVVCYRDGKPKASAIMREVGPDNGQFGTTLQYRVLHRAPEPEINVGDEVTAKRADTLPSDSIVQRGKGTYPMIKAAGSATWRRGPSDVPSPSLAREYGPAATFRVLSIGGK